MIDHDKLTFYNMVMFYKPELNKILKNDEYSSSVFTDLVRIRLRKIGILIHVRYKGKYLKRHTRILYPSCLTSMILSGLFDEYDFME
ncbi:hypothetical protein ES702_01441 [subsurface metagenome]